MDRISNLPDEIICHIVYLLSAKEAAFATVLSKRWQNVFTIIPSLDFKGYSKIQGSLMDFCDGVLALPASSRIRKFSLYCGPFDDSAHYAHLNRCICNVLKRGVMSLELEIYVKDGYLLPFEVFICKTVVELKLGLDFSIQCAFQKLLSVCHVLEELTLHDVDLEKWQWSGIISSPTLQRLTIKRGEYEGFGSITFDTPSLVFLNYSDLIPDEYPTVNLDSLYLVLTVDHAWVEGVADENDLITSDPTNLIKGLRNVEILNLQEPETVEMFYLFREAIPIFKNMHHLSFTIMDECPCWRFLPVLLKKTPNLKTLVIKGPLHLTEFDEKEPDYVCVCLSGYSFLLSCPLEVLEISLHEITTEELEQVKHFVGKLPCLELLKVRVLTSRDDKENLKLTTNLLMFPRASPKCKLQVEFVFPQR